MNPNEVQAGHLHIGDMSGDHRECLTGLLRFISALRLGFRSLKKVIFYFSVAHCNGRVTIRRF
jgi:hypothetical protein